MNSIPRFHVITDESIQSRYTHHELASLAIEGGAEAIQFREKRDRSGRDLLRAAWRVATICRGADVPLVVNDRVDIAMAISAPAIHVGREDLPGSIVRSCLGDRVVIGGTANSLDEAEGVWKTPVDYLGVGPVFGTTSKPNPAPPLGLEQLSHICERCPLPVIAIGNIQPENVNAVMDAGAWGVAVLSGIVQAPDIPSATASYFEELSVWLNLNM